MSRISILVRHVLLRQGRSGLRLVYDVMNLGKTGIIASCIHGNQGVLHHAALPRLFRGLQHRVSSLIYLGTCTHLLGWSIDDTQQVGERNKSNNKARVMVGARSCDQTQPDRAPRAPVLHQ